MREKPCCFKLLALALCALAVGSLFACSPPELRTAAQRPPVSTPSQAHPVPGTKAMPRVSVRKTGKTTGTRRDQTAGTARLPAGKTSQAVPGMDFQLRRNLYRLTYVPTYDGSGQETHPKLLYFPHGWNGYRYWMSFTPYPGTDARYENPSIVTSNDGKAWAVPKGLKNPVAGVPDDVSGGGYYSDPQLVMRGRIMELWYRYNKASECRGNSRLDRYYRIRSSDGVHWTVPELMHASRFGTLSLAVLWTGSRYQFWYTTYSYDLIHAVSTDGKDWEEIKPCAVSLPTGFRPYHQDVISYRNRYYLLQTAIRQKEYSFSLFMLESGDGIHFSKSAFFSPSSSPVILDKTWMYRSTLAPVDQDDFLMVVSYCLPGRKWFMTECVLPVSRWDAACSTGKPVILK